MCDAQVYSGVVSALCLQRETDASYHVGVLAPVLFSMAGLITGPGSIQHLKQANKRVMTQELFSVLLC